MSEMVERVALEISEFELDGASVHEKYQANLTLAARAAIAALREPTWDMREAFREKFVAHWLAGPNTTPTVQEMDDMYRAMIDEALK